jgi:hypothetical protein
MSKRGFRRERTLFALKFEDPEFEGLEVMAKSMPLRDYFAIQKLQDKADTDPEAAEELLRKLASVIVSWNLTDEDDQPVPPTYEGLAEQELSFVMPVFFAWMQAVASVPNPSPGTSNGSGTSVEDSMPMEALSMSPGN